MIIRPMRSADLPQVLALQHLAYPPALWDAAPAFESRLALAPSTNLVLERDGAIAAYLISHPWPGQAPPAVDTVLSPLPAPPHVWFIHDLTTGPAVRGSGAGRALFKAGAQAARALGLAKAELIAIEGAEPFWARLGFVRLSADPDLAIKVAGYGARAVYMERPL